MEIKNYKKVRGNLYEIEFDDAKKIKLYDDIILKYELLIEKRVDKKKLEKIILENNMLDAYYRALKYIGIRMRSELEIKRYLKQKDFNDFECEFAVTKLRKDGYINEDRYAQAYINDSLNLSLDGPKKIANNLEKLGIGRELTVRYLEEISSNEWRERIRRYVNKKAKVNKNSEKMFKNKVTAELLNLGYSYDDIKSVLDNFEIDTTDVFNSEASKIYNKLSIKYDEVELELRFKSKMFSKGYNSDLINDFINKKH